MARGFPCQEPRVYELFEDALDAMRDAGAILIDPTNLDASAWNDPLSLVLLEYEFKHDLNAYLAGLPTKKKLPARTLEELIEFNRKHAEKEMPYFDQEIFEKSQAISAAMSAME